ncbi:MAG: hypothetical protein A3I06_16765 [Candidatus Lindowbacteria bacterium RIFCSPLOWO2_02_FULL_62_12]|nr:MAG: hypothetical protein A3I06_16765 [Candidatus Lindowbacteria bacterium RIFCSPLOWO2_02_FULL_62_12]
MFQFDEPLWRGAWHLLFSFEKGFFIYSPVVLLSLLFWRHFHRAHPQVSLAILVYAGLYLIVYSGWYASSPGKELSYGQRFLLPVVPVALLALPECLSRLRRNVWSIAAVLVLWVSFLVQAAGCLQTGLAYRNWAAQFESEPSPLVGYVLLTVRDPATIRVWWWQSGALGRSAGVALVCLAVYFAVLSVRRNRAAG